MDKKGLHHKLYHKIELLVDRSIPYFVVLLLASIILEFFYRKEAEPYSQYIKIAYYITIGIFCVDLIFKYLKVRRVPEFLKHHWLDILAIFPFFLIFRIFEEVYLIASLPKLFTEPPTILREAIILEKEGIRLMRAAEHGGKISRTRLMLKIMKPIIHKFPKLLKVFPYYERPTHEHHKALDKIRIERLKNKEG